MRMPARNGDWNRLGSVAVTQCQRCVCRKGRELPRRVEASGREIGPAFVREDLPVELVVPEDGQRLTLRVVLGACELDDRGLAGCVRLDDLLDQPPPGAYLDQLACGRRAFGEIPCHCRVHTPAILHVRP